MSNQYRKLYSDNFCDLQDMGNGFAWYSDITLFAFPIPIKSAIYIAKKLKENLKHGLKLIDFSWEIYKALKYSVPMNEEE